jgi:ATP-dependent Clp protease ATP-binding subunit ClpX
MAVLHELDREALKRILTETKNALIKQYHRIFSFEDVELEFTDGAISEIASIAISRESGARGLRSVLETIMLDLMFDIPSMKSISRVVITEEMIKGVEKPKIVFDKEEKSA